MPGSIARKSCVCDKNPHLWGIQSLIHYYLSVLRTQLFHTSISSSAKMEWWSHLVQNQPAHCASCSSLSTCFFVPVSSIPFLVTCLMAVGREAGSTGSVKGKDFTLWTPGCQLASFSTVHPQSKCLLEIYSVDSAKCWEPRFSFPSFLQPGDVLGVSSHSPVQPTKVPLSDRKRGLSTASLYPWQSSAWWHWADNFMKRVLNQR